jgi:hypothetical protein
MANYSDLGYSSLLNIQTNASSINSSNSESLIADGSIGYSRTSLSKLQPGEDVESGNFLSGIRGWKLYGDGNAEFVGITLSGGILKYGKTSFSDSTNAGYYFGPEGSYQGSASDASYIKYTIADETYTIKATIDGDSTIGGRIASTLAAAIDASGHFADDAIDTANGTILGDFTFGVLGAIQIGNYVNGVTGDIRISPTGILGRDKDNNTTFSINATTGIAILNGLVVGMNVGLGTAQDSAGVTTIIGDTVTTSFINALNVNAATVSASISITTPTITGGTIQTSATGQRAVMSGTSFSAYDGSDVLRVTIYGGSDASIILYDDATIEQAYFLSTKDTLGASSAQNHNGLLKIQANNDFFLRTGINNTDNIVSFQSPFDDGRVNSTTNTWLRFRVNNSTTDNDYALSLYTKTFINPAVIVFGLCDTPVADHLKRKAGTGFTAADVGKKVWNRKDNTFAIVTAYNSSSDLTIDTDIFTEIDVGYELFFEPTAYLDVNSDIVRIRTAKTPATAAATGNIGDICWDDSNIYVCVDTDTWKKVAIATW